MNDYWVKPTVEQLRAELEWQQGRDRARRRTICSIVAVAVAAILSVTWLLPRVNVIPGYALEETIPDGPEDQPEAEEQNAAEPAE